MNRKVFITVPFLLFFFEPAHMKESPNTIAESIIIQDREFNTDALPISLTLNPDLGIVSAPYFKAEIIHRARDAERGLYEIRGTVTPKGSLTIIPKR